MIVDKRYRNLIFLRLTKESKRAISPPISSRSNRENRKFLSSLRLGFVGGCELEFIKGYLEQNGASCYHTFEHGESSDPLIALNEEDCGVYSFQPDFIIISDTQQFQDYIRMLQLGKSTFDLQASQIQESTERVLNSIKIARRSLQVNFIILDYPLKIRPTHGYFDYLQLENTHSLREFLMQLNLEYYKISRQEENVFFLSIPEAFLKAEKGFQIRQDDADGIYEHLTQDGAVTVSNELIHLLKIQKGFGQRKKCVVVDLDNTLWDGIIRDDGIAGIRVYHNRLVILSLLAKRGILLAIASKNDASSESAVKKILGSYWDMFVVKKINWNDKAQSLHEIASELNIGTNSLAFFDDNPFERAQIEQFLPEVQVYPDTEIVNSLNLLEFEPVGKLTQESDKRGQMYRQQMKRDVAKQDFQFDKVGFLKNSKIEAWFREAKEENLGRVTELILRTNQLNATTKRYSNEEIIAFYNSKTHKIYVVDLWDSYGEYGLIGVALIELEKERWVADILTFSCRAMGKSVEQAFLSYIMAESQKSKASALIGKYKQTSRNDAIEKIFKEVGFAKKNGTTTDYILWEYNFAKKPIPSIPTWIKMRNNS